MASIVGTDLPKLLEGFKISFTVPNKLMQDQFHKGRPKLLKFLREKLNNYGIDIIAILNEKKLEDIISTKLPSIMHYTSDGYTTWFNVANEILVNLNEYYSNLGVITPIEYSEWLSKATRPKDSRLSIDYILLSSLNIKLNPWEFGIKEVLKRLNS